MRSKISPNPANTSTNWSGPHKSAKGYQHHEQNWSQKEREWRSRQRQPQDECGSAEKTRGGVGGRFSHREEGHSRVTGGDIEEWSDDNRFSKARMIQNEIDIDRLDVNFINVINVINQIRKIIEDLNS